MWRAAADGHPGNIACWSGVIMPANDKTGQPANDNGPCSTPVLAPRQRNAGIKPPATLATSVPANDNGANTAVLRDSGSGTQISPPSVRDRSAGPHFYILKEVASALRKSERWLWDWLKKHPQDRDGRPFFRLAGRTKILTAEDITRLSEALLCHSPSGPRARAKRRIMKSGARTSESLLNEARELLTRNSPSDNCARSSAQSSAARVNRKPSSRRPNRRSWAQQSPTWRPAASENISGQFWRW